MWLHNTLQPDVRAKYIAILIAVRTNKRDGLQIAMLKAFYLQLRVIQTAN
jgi:hypothetical protein